MVYGNFVRVPWLYSNRHILQVKGHVIMTKKDYIKFAEMFKAIRNKWWDELGDSKGHQWNDTNLLLEDIEDRLVRILQDDNERFDEERFCEASGRYE